MLDFNSNVLLKDFRMYRIYMNLIIAIKLILNM